MTFHHSAMDGQAQYDSSQVYSSASYYLEEQCWQTEEQIPGYGQLHGHHHFQDVQAAGGQSQPYHMDHVHLESQGQQAMYMSAQMSKTVAYQRGDLYQQQPSETAMAAATQPYCAAAAVVGEAAYGMDMHAAYLPGPPPPPPPPPPLASSNGLSAEQQLPAMLGTRPPLLTVPSEPACPAPFYSAPQVVPGALGTGGSPQKSPMPPPPPRSPSGPGFLKKDPCLGVPALHRPVHEKQPFNLQSKQQVEQLLSDGFDGDPSAISAGSAEHGSGNCKPCAFLHTKGCENGSNCTFCHLCEPGEKKRRRKDKMEMQKSLRKLSQIMPRARIHSKATM